MVTSTKKTEFVLTSTSTGVILYEQYDFRKYASCPRLSWYYLPHTPENKEIGKMIVRSLMDMGDYHEAVRLCVSMMYSVIENRRVVDQEFFKWAWEMGNEISWIDDYAMEYFDDSIDDIDRLLGWN